MDPEQLDFPDQPRGALDATISTLVAQANEVLSTQGRLRALLKANQSVIEHIELPVVLRSIVDAAVELVGCRYCALGVTSASGGLEEFITVGMTEEEEAAIGRYPEGLGLLGAIIDDPRPIRIPHIAADPRSEGLPSGHPSMESFLGVPIRVRDEVFGNLYLCDPLGDEFTEEDEQLVVQLAATAGFAIHNARMFAETRRRQAWSAASAEITAALLSGTDVDPMDILVERILHLAEADLSFVALPDGQPDSMMVRTVHGLDEELLAGSSFPAAGTITGSVLEGLQPRLVEVGADEDAYQLKDGRRLGPVIAVPLIASGTAEGVLLVVRLAGRPRFTAADLELAADFAGQATVAIELARAREAQQTMALLEDRGRIARDLHDHVIQQLFGTGLELQSIAGGLGSTRDAERLSQAVADLDSAIAQIRTAIFALSERRPRGAATLRHSILDVANELAGSFTSSPTVSFSGPVDLAVVDGLADDVVAVVRETLTNAAKHAEATETSVQVTAAAGEVRVVVSDDGRGVAPGGRRSGLANLERRASDRGGSFSIEAGAGGTTVSWTAPLGAH